MFNPALYRRPPTGLRRAEAGRLRALAGLLGPAFVVSVAYVDPGNFATNVAGGARYGPMLLWVVAAANLLAMLVQYLSAKLGIATSRSLPELCREELPRPVTWLLWAQAEIVAMVTDLAEFVGAAVALNLLFGVPLLPAALITAVVSFAVLAASPEGRRRFQTVIVGMLAVIMAGFLYQAIRVGPPAGAVYGMVPRLAGMPSLLLTTGIVGATVMPHVVYLHSALTGRRPDGRRHRDRRAALRATRVDIVAAMGLAGLLNMTLLLVAASAFHGTGRTGVGTLAGAYNGLGELLGGGAAAAFGLALLASGLASSSVGTYAGQIVMAGFLRRRVPLLLRRAVTMAPALTVLASGVEPTRALVLSQVVLCFGIPFALVPLVLLTSRRRVMGGLANRRPTAVTGAVVAVALTALSTLLAVGSIRG
jgi:manganese transport protein